MKRFIIPIIIILGLVTALCFKMFGGKECTMIVRISGEGCDESGEPLDSVEDEKTSS